jgi:hypothetical protein
VKKLMHLVFVALSVEDLRSRKDEDIKRCINGEEGLDV